MRVFLFAMSACVAALRFGPYDIRWQAHPDLCFDVAGGATSYGTNIRLWGCDATGGHPNQQFYITYPEGHIQWAAHPELCLDASGGRAGTVDTQWDRTNIQLWGCDANGGHNNQQWIFNEYGNIRWEAHQDLCMDASGGRAGSSPSEWEDTNIHIWGCNANGGHNNQQFLVGTSTSELASLFSANWSALGEQGGEPSLRLVSAHNPEHAEQQWLSTPAQGVFAGIALSSAVAALALAALIGAKKRVVPALNQPLVA